MNRILSCSKANWDCVVPNPGIPVTGGNPSHMQNPGPGPETRVKQKSSTSSPKLEEG